ncbi:diguanylate cyclase [Actinoplanes utahensis]|uniref:Diguanylate cyclase n=2 Tax=Actinoplanes utahensis TaxID=1869 RepID=A0A0A6UD81_ACTUT|nr:diguanylate cyclase [Actinoplanes utahensis]
MTKGRGRLFLGCAAVAVGLLMTTYDTTLGNGLYVLVYLALCGVVWTAALREPPGPNRRPWILVALAQTLWFAGDAIELGYYYLTPEIPTVGLSDVCWLTGYALLAVALTMMARRRAAGRMRGAVLDALTLTVAAALASWQFLILPALDEAYTLAEKVVPPLYPIADVVLLSAVLFIALSPGGRTAPTYLLLSAVTLFLAIDLSYNVLPFFLDYSIVARIQPLILFGNALITAALLHPKRAELTRAGHQVHLLHPSRVLFLGLAFMTAPALTLLKTGLERNALIALAATALSASFVLARFATAVREQEKAQAQLAFQARHDSLTGLANRAVLVDRLASPGPVALLYLDLDGFKEINDARGHDAGDAVLTAVAARLSAAVRATDLVVRLGGDEFVLLCPDLPAEEAVNLAQRVLAEVAQPIPFEGTMLEVGVSVGIAAPGGDRNVLRAADMAMYEAKRLGKGRYVIA